MAKTIEQFVAERGIKSLLHFTRESNLSTILKYGLVTRERLTRSGKDLCNDQHRIDGTDAVCATISFPNYKMFWGLRQGNPGVDWILLVVDPSVLWKTQVAFCTANAASNTVTKIPLDERMGLPAFRAMFNDYDDERTRDKLKLPDAYPTNPQAEVLLLEGVPLSLIKGALVLNNVQKNRLEAQHSGFRVVADARAYRYRSDFEHWK